MNLLFNFYSISLYSILNLANSDSYFSLLLFSQIILLLYSYSVILYLFFIDASFFYILYSNYISVCFRYLYTFCFSFCNSYQPLLNFYDYLSNCSITSFFYFQNFLCFRYYSTLFYFSSAIIYINPLPLIFYFSFNIQLQSILWLLSLSPNIIFFRI